LMAMSDGRPIDLTRQHLSAFVFVCGAVLCGAWTYITGRDVIAPSARAFAVSPGGPTFPVWIAAPVVAYWIGRKSKGPSAAFLRRVHVCFTVMIFLLPATLRFADSMPYGVGEWLFAVADIGVTIWLPIQ